jgi:hypothetical protein
MQLPGSELSGSVQLRTSLVLLEAGSDPIDPLSATMPGSVLWADRIALVLGHDTVRFPVTVADFAATGLGEVDSCWRLDWSPRALDAPAVATLRLWINSGHASFHRAITAGGRSSSDAVMRNSLRVAVAFEMLRLALSEVDALADDNFEDGSAGQVFKDLIGQVFPGVGVRAVGRLSEEDPGRFTAVVQARMGLYGTSMQLGSDP